MLRKLAGTIENTASWMTNVGNEWGQILNSVLTVGEGPHLKQLCQGIVQRYRDAQEGPPAVIYVDNLCCATGKDPAMLNLFSPWKCQVRLDSFHFMRRFTKGLNTEHHPLYGNFCQRLSGCVFEWDPEDSAKLQAARESEWKKDHGSGSKPPDATTKERAKFCRRRVRTPEQIETDINKLLTSMAPLTDDNGLHLINAEKMEAVWANQRQHLKCLQDIPGVDLYHVVKHVTKGSYKLQELRCGRGSSSLESFHRHQASFIPGKY